MDRTEISEIFCSAVDTIIKRRLENLTYDITKSCTIINNDSRRQGKYIVSDGSVSFEAYSQEKTLEVDDTVMVTIPNGDYNSNNIVIAKLEPDIPEASTYTSQLDLMQIFSGNIINTNLEDQEANPGLLANDDNSSSYIGPLYILRNHQGDLSGYTRLGISAEFQSLLNNVDVTSGNYGLKIYIYSSIPTAPGEVSRDGIYELNFDSSEMIGNPYLFSAFAKQEKVIDISMIENITKIEIYFYQNGNFKDSNDNNIDWEYTNNITNLESGKMPNNLFVQNIQLFLGFEAGTHKDDTMIISCLDPLTYSYVNYDINTNQGPAKRLNLKWLHKFEEGNKENSKYELLNMNSLKNLGITLKWFKYNLNAKVLDQYAGRGWEEIPMNKDDLFNCTFIPNRNLAEEKIKVVGYKTDITYESSNQSINNKEYIAEWQNLQTKRNEYETQEEFNKALEQLKYKHLKSIASTQIYESDILTLTNTVAVYDSVTFGASSSLSIYYDDGSEGNYFIYDTNGRIINQGQGRGYERRMRAVYDGKEITPDLGTLDYIAWYLPIGNNSKTMLLDTQAYYTKDNGEIASALEEYQGVQYICIRRFPNRDDNTLNTWQSYSINNNWNNSYTNNLIRCEVSINGVRYVASNTMRFGKAGSQGTNTTLILEMQNNYNAISIPVPKNNNNQDIEYCVVGLTYDINGNKLDSSSGSWEWEWKTPMVMAANNKPAIEIIKHPKESNKIYLKPNIQSLDELANGYYGILKATYNQINDMTLTAYLNIPLKKAGYSHIEGAQEITYTSSGTPQYYSDAYKIFVNKTLDVNEIDFDERFDVDWDVVHDIDYYKLDLNGNRIRNPETNEYEVSRMSANYIPKLHQLVRNGRAYQGLRAASFYASGYDEICVICRSNLESEGTYVPLHTILPQNFISEVYYYKRDESVEEYTLATEYDSKTNYYRFDKGVLWIQPLLITNSQYDYSVLNDWNGTLVTDEGSGTVMGTIIGAGRKNENNTFSGILMGDVQDNADISEGGSYVLIASPGEMSRSQFEQGVYYYQKDDKTYEPASIYDSTIPYYTLRAATGLYGFQDGAISFSLKDNGVATFGKADRGQIIINGNESTLTSRSYHLNGNGMLLDLDEGQLFIKDNNKTKFQLSPEEPYLVISGRSDTEPMIYIAGEECYLQSEGRTLNNKGTKLDLVQGILDIRGSGGNVLLSGREIDPFFKVVTRDGATLIHMDTDGYYLQSAGFEADSAIRKTDDELKLDIYHEKEYVPIVLNEDLFKERYFINDEGNIVSRYFVYDIASNKYIGLTNSDTEIFNPDTEYFRQGDQLHEIYGYDSNNSTAYVLSYNSDDELYIAKNIIDPFELDKDTGEFIYPFLQQIERYEVDYTSVGMIEEIDFEPNVYYTSSINDDGETVYTVADSYIPGIEYFSRSVHAIYKSWGDTSEESDINIIVAGLINEYFENYLTPVPAETVPSGMKLDLVDGRIEGYNLKLIGTKVNREGKVINRLIINTEADTTPVQIGGSFSIGWDGSLICTNVKQITNKGTIPPMPASRSGVYGDSDLPIIDLGTFKVYGNGDTEMNQLTAESITGVVARREFFEYNNEGEEVGSLYLSKEEFYSDDDNDHGIPSKYLRTRDFEARIKDYLTISSYNEQIANYLKSDEASKTYALQTSVSWLSNQFENYALKTEVNNLSDTITQLQAKIVELEQKITKLENNESNSMI